MGRHRDGQIVADRFLMLQEFLADYGADRVTPNIGWSRLAFAVAKLAGHSITPAHLKITTKHISLRHQKTMTVSRPTVRQ